MAKPLTVHERELMDSYLAGGHGPRAVARLMGVHRTTVQRHKRKRAATASINGVLGEWKTVSVPPGTPGAVNGKITFRDGVARLPDYRANPNFVKVIDSPLTAEQEQQAHEFGRAKYGDFNWKPTPDANRPRAKAWGIANVVFAGLALGVLASALLSAYHTYIATP